MGAPEVCLQIEYPGDGVVRQFCVRNQLATLIGLVALNWQ